jgi:hypothetical protein
MLERERESITTDQAMQATGDSPALERFRMARAAMAELDLKVKEAALIPVDDVYRQWALRVAEVCAGLEFLADRLPPLLAGKRREEMQRVIGDEIWRLRDSYCRTGVHCETRELG